MAEGSIIEKCSNYERSMGGDAVTSASSQRGRGRSTSVAALARWLHAQATGPESFTFWVLVLGLAYAAATLTPSSYGLALKSFFGAGTPGLVFGTPQPLRSDEWAVWTPYVQIAVNNDFLRTNGTSIYNEDLRNFNALPLLDWALLFKPQYWAFFIFPAPWAFSTYHGFLIVAFLIGWERALRLLGFDRTIAALISLCLFFVPCTQLWWTTTGPLPAFFPWLLVLFLADLNPFVRIAAMAWAAAAFLLSHLYPPIILSLGFAGAILLAAQAPDKVRQVGRLASAGIGTALGIGIALIYLHEPLQIMSQTVYPGARSLGGGGLPVLQWWAQFFPDLVSSRRQSLIGLNYLEVSTGGTYFAALVWAFLSFQPARQRAAGDWLKLGLIALGLALISAWMLAPVPAAIGHLLLWDIVPAQRFVFAFGLLLLVGCVVTVERFTANISPIRIALCVSLLVGVFAWSRLTLGGRVTDASGLVIGIAVFFAALCWRKQRLALAGLAGALAASIISYGGYNPIQLAGPIFKRPDTAAMKALDGLQARNPDGWLVVPGYPGAVLNGWGYRSVSHVLIAPQLAFFRERFPEMSDAEFNHVFNRYAHVQLSYADVPDTPQGDVLRVPITAFRGEAPHPPLLRQETDISRLPGVLGGTIDEIVTNPSAGTVTVAGWALIDAGSVDPALVLYAPGATVEGPVTVIYRPDVVIALGDPGLQRAGFMLTLRMSGDVQLGALCLASRDSVHGARLLRLPAGKGVTCPRGE